jgi:hypothetical protein
MLDMVMVMVRYVLMSRDICDDDRFFLQCHSDRRYEVYRLEDGKRMVNVAILPTMTANHGPTSVVFQWFTTPPPTFPRHLPVIGHDANNASFDKQISSVSNGVGGLSVVANELACGWGGVVSASYYIHGQSRPSFIANTINNDGQMNDRSYSLMSSNCIALGDGRVLLDGSRAHSHDRDALICWHVTNNQSYQISLPQPDVSSNTSYQYHHNTLLRPSCYFDGHGNGNGRDYLIVSSYDRRTCHILDPRDSFAVRYSYITDIATSHLAYLGNQPLSSIITIPPSRYHVHQWAVNMTNTSQVMTTTLWIIVQSYIA